MKMYRNRFLCSTFMQFFLHYPTLQFYMQGRSTHAQLRIFIFYLSFYLLIVKLHLMFVIIYNQSINTVRFIYDHHSDGHEKVATDVLKPLQLLYESFSRSHIVC